METSRSEIHEKSETAEEAKKELRSSNIRIRWSRTKNAETQLIIGEDFHKKAEAVIEVGKGSGQREPGRQIVRRRRTEAKGRKDAEEDSFKDNDSSVGIVHCDPLCQSVGKRVRQRTDVKKTDGRDMQEHQKENKITDEKADDDKKEREKDLEHEICVITWNVNKSSAQYDLLTHNWQADGTAEELV